MLRKKFAQRYFAEAFAVGSKEVLSVAVVDEAEDAPHVVLQVRVIEIHFPAAARWREAAKQQQSGVFGDERGKRVCFDGCVHDGEWTKSDIYPAWYKPRFYPAWRLRWYLLRLVLVSRSAQVEQGFAVNADFVAVDVHLQGIVTVFISA